MPSTPAMTTGMIFFMSNCGDRMPIAMIPDPAFAVPYAPPMSEKKNRNECFEFVRKKKSENKFASPSTCNRDERWHMHHDLFPPFDTFNATTTSF
jgi:hypothetical protein